MTDLVAFSSRQVSPSRIGTYADCGHAFKLKYIDGVQPERDGTSSLFGLVMHKAREQWVMDRDLDFVKLVEKAWLSETQHDKPAHDFITGYVRLSAEARVVKEQILARRPDITFVTRTKDWKESTIALKIEAYVSEQLPKLVRSRYDFEAGDPLPGLYDESMSLAPKYSDKYRRLPNAYLTEIKFDFEWEGFRLVGYIDEVCPLMDRDTGEFIGHGIVDAKTYRVEKHEFKDWRQCAIYTLAYHHLIAIGALPFKPARVIIGIDRMRLLTYKWFELQERDFKRLKHELRMYQSGVEAGVFIPASKTCNVRYCDFKAACEHYHGAAAEPLELNVA